MAKSRGYLDMNNENHGFLWWLLIGWWWRPLKYIFFFVVANIFGFKGVRVKRHH